MRHEWNELGVKDKSVNGEANEDDIDMADGSDLSSSSENSMEESGEE